MTSFADQMVRIDDLVSSAQRAAYLYGSAISGSISSTTIIGDGMVWLQANCVVPESVLAQVPRVPYAIRPASRTAPADDADTAEFPVAAEMTAAVLQWLSLSVTELAEVLDVERATIYGWRDGKRKWPRQSAVAERLNIVFKLACQWRSVSGGRELGTLRHLPVDGSLSLLELLRTKSALSDKKGVGRVEALLVALANQRSANLTTAQQYLAAERARGVLDPREGKRRSAQYLRGRRRLL